MALAPETYNGDIMAFKKFQQNVLDDLQAQGKGWTVKRPGQVNHRSLEVIPEPLGDQIDGDDGQQIITPTSTRMRHDENIRKLLEINARIEADCEIACQIFYRRLGKDALIAIGPTKNSTNLTSRDKIMVLFTLLKDHYVGDNSTTRDRLSNKMGTLPKIYDRQTALQVIKSMDEIQGMYQEMRNPANNALDGHFAKPDSDMVETFLKLYIGRENFGDSINFLARERQGNRLTWEALKIEVRQRCNILELDEEKARYEDESTSVRAIKSAMDTEAEIARRVAVEIDEFKRTGKSQSPSVRELAFDNRDSSKDQDSRYEERGRYHSRDRGRGRDQSQDRQRARHRSNSFGRDRERRDVSEDRRQQSDRDHYDSRRPRNDSRGRGDRDRSRDRSQEDRGRYDRNRRDEREREPSGSGKRRT